MLGACFSDSFGDSSGEYNLMLSCLTTVDALLELDGGGGGGGCSGGLESSCKCF